VGTTEATTVATMEAITVEREERDPREDITATTHLLHHLSIIQDAMQPLIATEAIAAHNPTATKSATDMVGREEKEDTTEARVDTIHPDAKSFVIQSPCQVPFTVLDPALFTALDPALSTVLGRLMEDTTEARDPREVSTMVATTEAREARDLKEDTTVTTQYPTHNLLTHPDTVPSTLHPFTEAITEAITEERDPREDTTVTTQHHCLLIHPSVTQAPAAGEDIVVPLSFLPP